jgi:nitrogen regulatory protein PII-like uncharacterized protein
LAKAPQGVDEFTFRRMRFEAAIQILKYVAVKAVFSGAVTDEEKAKRSQVCRRAYLWVDELWDISDSTK